MAKLFSTILFTTLLFAGSVAAQSADTENRQFFENLKTLCGNSYAGEVVHPEEAPEGFRDLPVAHFTVCEGNEIRIPFHVGDNESRTWILTMEGNRLLFKHDHRHPDGTPEDMTNYGGWASDEGDMLKQRFPADEETIAMRDNLRSHIWKMELSSNGSTFSYSLYLYEDLYFQADFDLTEPIE